jgi:hypothetical protein
VNATLLAFRIQVIDRAADREGHASLLDTVAAGLDTDGHPEHASRARARAATLRESAADLRDIAGPVTTPRDRAA